MPYYNMSVASDPTSSWQVRTKGKAIKALLGDRVPYFGDQVELSDNATDFAATVGVGGVVGSQFTLPAVASRATQFDLTPARRKIFEKWVALYKEKMLSEGTYEGTLYDIGFDRPEAHAIKKGDAMYYAFFAPTFDGKVELRGLEDRDYKVTDYENNKVLGTVHGPTAKLNANFTKHLMLEADPQ
jgi:alpha-galactosidase